MRTQPNTDGSWLAQVRFMGRSMVAEGATRNQAFNNLIALMLERQIREVRKNAHS